MYRGGGRAGGLGEYARPTWTPRKAGRPRSRPPARSPVYYDHPNPKSGTEILEEWAEDAALMHESSSTHSPMRMSSHRYATPQIKPEPPGDYMDDDMEGEYLPTSAATLQNSLEAAWNHGNVDVLELGKAIHDAKLCGDYSDEIYRSFIESRAGSYDVGGYHTTSYEFRSQYSSVAENFTHFMEGNNALMTIMGRALKKAREEPPKVIRRVGEKLPLGKKGFVQPPSMNGDTVNPCHLRKTFKVEADTVFKNLNFNLLINQLNIPKHSSRIGLTYVFRRIFQNLTHNPADIQKYTIRRSGRGNQKFELEDLPAHILKTMEACGLELLNLGHDDLSNDPSSDYKIGRFYTGLGDDDLSREAKFEELRQKRLEWTVSIPTLLQSTLRDLRHMQVLEEEKNGQVQYRWVNDKKKKDDQDTVTVE